MVLSETWLKPDCEILLGQVHQSYEIFRCDRVDLVGGGVAMIVRKDHCPYMVFSESVDDSYQVAACNVRLGESQIRIIGVYRSPRCSSKSNVQLCKCVSDLTACAFPCLLLGYFNYPNNQWSSQSGPLAHGFTSFLDVMVAHQYDQLVGFDTRGKQALELLFCNVTSSVKRVDLSAPLGSSDHASVLFELNVPTVSPDTVWIRDFKLANYRDSGRYLDDVDWFGLLVVPLMLM